MKISHDSEVAAHGQQVITACAFIHRERDGKYEVFLPRRAATKKFLPGVFELPGGHIDYGEDIVTGLKREIDEEFGVAITVGSPFGVFDYVNEIKGSHSIEVVYFAQFADPEAHIVLNPADHSEYIWFTGEDYTAILNEIKGESDPEIQIIKQGMALLAGGSVSFG